MTQRHVPVYFFLYHSFLTIMVCLFFTLPLLLIGCSPPVSKDSRASKDISGQATFSSHSAEDFLIVDCLLPGRIRKLGRKVVYAEPRRALKTTAIDCEIRGGEYVAYDRANYQTALKVWLKDAKGGDKKAQTYVGEIYEKGLGTNPDYIQAAQWYRKAAERGYARAQMNLGFLYEKGLGVEKNMAVAMDWYRKASGLRDDITIGISAPGTNETHEVERLREEIKRKDDELNELLNQFNEIEKKLHKDSGRNVEESGLLRNKIAVLEDQVNRLQDERRKQRPKLPGLATVDFGKYYALIIGNNKYKYLENLKTAVNDARDVNRILKTKYGFKTRLLINAKRDELISALHDFQLNVSDRDNFLLYYAGHGEIDQKNKKGHWLPVDAEKQNPSNWVKNDDITDILNTMEARHILVIADSCYSGTMTALSVPRLIMSLPGNLLSYAFNTMVKNHSRTLLSSGGLSPVLDEGSDKHSVFANVLLNVLESNNNIIQGKDLHAEVSPQVSMRASSLGVEQEAIYAALQFVGHKGGDFFFMPVGFAQKTASHPTDKFLTSLTK